MDKMASYLGRSAVQWLASACTAKTHMRPHMRESRLIKKFIFLHYN